jgi:hypothetical protein
MEQNKLVKKDSKEAICSYARVLDKSFRGSKIPKIPELGVLSPSALFPGL